MGFDVKSGPERAVGLRARDDERLMQAVVEVLGGDGVAV
jgi:hypothetical protein